VDCTLKGIEADGLAATEALLDFAREHGHPIPEARYRPAIYAA